MVKRQLNVSMWTEFMRVLPSYNIIVRGIIFIINKYYTLIILSLY